MHEAGLIKDLMRKILDIANERGAKRVVGVSVWLGALSHMSPEHFAEHFNAVAPGTIAEGAKLHSVVSEDEHHANAQGVLLESIDVEE